jgi:Flp pilus assembly protein TadB
VTAYGAAHHRDRKNQRSGGRLRWFAIVVGVVVAFVAVLGALAGDLLTAVVFGLAALVNVGQVALNARFRPKSVARSLEASRAVVAEGG